ncbi:class I SAM-dependent methyltransferase [Mycobacterium vicinigordonae]|uniref:Class I SAM-dependent methyltransferase n=1 Tax=Mycobacterium vicinigordonae TaxID=1719132 RepID=A0A7D6E281_9MYCO|nr:class I SAM-dependent methyltransferase [Mycobacterium vicinigordonae]QLL10327.1 class I SAM-dependent methyltransferase [Mycobacterium vicinigordonae]
MSADLIYRSAAAGRSCWSRNHHGHRRDLPIDRWMGGAQSTPQDRSADEHVLALCSSRPTLDVGCGPGRFAAALQQRGLPALGIDNSTAAVEMTRQRGGTAIRRDLFAPLPGEGNWDQVLLTDGNIGIGGDPVQTLRRAADLLAPGGVVIAEIDCPATSICYELIRWETDHHLGHWFPWSRVGLGALAGIAVAAGLLVTQAVDIHNRVITVLKADAGAQRGVNGGVVT